MSIFPGIDRSLKCFREVTVAGETLLGNPQTERIKVAEIGPLLVLKLNAFGGPSGRKAAKDAHDILYLATHYLDGASAAVEGFRAERRMENRGVQHALKCLEEFFLRPEAAGPVACAAFQLNNSHREPQNAEAALRIRQQCVTLAQALLA